MKCIRSHLDPARPYCRPAGLGLLGATPLARSPGPARPHCRPTGEDVGDVGPGDQDLHPHHEAIDPDEDWCPKCLQIKQAVDRDAARAVARTAHPCPDA
jgi:hypothetical protein